MKKCENCDNLHDETYGSGRFCNSKCARGYSTKEKRIEINKKVSISLKNHPPTNKLPTIIKKCKWCSAEFEVRKTSKRIYCSFKCKQSGNGRAGGMKSKQGKRSKNEILFSELCLGKFKNVLLNENIFNGWDADIILSDIKTAVLWNGKWHYEKITENHSVKQVQNRDKIKIKEIMKAGYIPYIIKDMGSYDVDFVNSQFEKFLKYIAG
jgi:hypothetical protein